MKTPVATGDAIATLGRKRLERFVALIPRIIVGGDSEAIHDARVASRRSQQILQALAPQPAKKNKQRKLLRALRNSREILGQPRNVDVMLKLVEEKVAGASNPVARDAWDQLRTRLKTRRTRALERAREALRGFDVVDFAARCRAVIERRGRCAVRRRQLEGKRCRGTRRLARCHHDGKSKAGSRGITYAPNRRQTPAIPARAPG